MLLFVIIIVVIVDVVIVVVIIVVDVVVIVIIVFVVVVAVVISIDVVFLLSNVKNGYLNIFLALLKDLSTSKSTFNRDFHLFPASHYTQIMEQLFLKKYGFLAKIG